MIQPVTNNRLMDSVETVHNTLLVVIGCKLHIYRNSDAPYNQIEISTVELFVELYF